MVIYILGIRMQIVLNGYRYLKDHQVHQEFKVSKVLLVVKVLLVMLVFLLELKCYFINHLLLLDGQNKQQIIIEHLEL